MELKFPSAEELGPAGLDERGFPKLSVYCQAVLNVLSKYHRSNVILTSFHTEVCTHIKEFYNNWSLGFLSDVDMGNLDLKAQFCFHHNITLLVIDSAVLMRESEDNIKQFINACHNNYRLSLWTYGLENSNASWVKRELNYGINAIITDDPQIVKEHFDVCSE